MPMSCDFNISILVTEITTQPNSSVTVVALRDLMLFCLASVADVVYSWHRVGGIIPSRSQGQNSVTFTIPGVTPYDEGMYYCMATKVGVIVESNRAIVKVDGKDTLCNSKNYRKTRNFGVVKLWRILNIDKCWH